MSSATWDRQNNSISPGFFAVGQACGSLWTCSQGVFWGCQGVHLVGPKVASKSMNVVRSIERFLLCARYMIYSSVYLHTFIYIYSISINISWFSLWLVAVSHSFRSWHAGLKIHSNAGKLLRSPTFLYKTSHRQKTCDSDPKKGEDRRLKQHKHQEINNMYLSLCTVVRRHSSFFQRIRGIYIYI